MSRIGKLPISVPGGVTITVDDGNTVTVKGPKGTLSEKISPDMEIEQDNGVLHVKRPSDDKRHRALHGLTRSLIHNMVVGVTEGFAKNLEIEGVGYRAQLQGSKLVLKKKASPAPVVSLTSTCFAGQTPLSPSIVAYTAPCSPIVTTMRGICAAFMRRDSISAISAGVLSS